MTESVKSLDEALKWANGRQATTEEKTKPKSNTMYYIIGGGLALLILLGLMYWFYSSRSAGHPAPPPEIKLINDMNNPSNKVPARLRQRTTN